MAEIINMPKLGFDMQEGTFANWVKAVGDSINAGDVIAEIETDKATVEVETYASGTLLHVLAEPGDIVAVGAPIAIIGKAGENYQSLLGQSSAPTSA
ncbi:MAG TPA: biotin/lipoyl-containing protein, partial [Aggregatilineales bacterium]|nr:biotin/lipoyl-containing protein [Aggregatilineales bacterium]